MSLRIRSTKTQLEDLGEDAEGAAENVSKLREQMLALTGVDIQLNKNTYKSTYQILLEMSKVWDKLDDMSRASVLEQLFGKRQANIGAAILSNGELLQQVYETSEKASDGIGSAMREQEEYAKSIQYNLNSLKASYQQLAQEIVQSGTVVTIVKALNEELQSLGSSDIVVGINAVSQSLITLTKTALDAKEKIESLPAIGGLAEMGLDRVRGVSFLKAAGKIYDLFNKNKKAVEEAARKQEELNVNYEKSSKIYDEETDNLQSLTTEYLKLAANTEDAESAKKSLMALQSNIADKYGDEAEGINLVNKSLEENVKWLIERQKVLDETFLKENAESIEQAKKKFGVESIQDKSKYGFGNLSFGDESDLDEEAKREAKLYARAVSEYLKEHYSDIFESSITEGEYGFSISAGITPKQQEKAAEALVKAYEQAFDKYKNLQNKVLDTDEIKEFQRKWLESISQSVEVLQKAGKATENVDAIKAFIGNEKDLQKFDELLLKLSQYNEILNSDEPALAEKVSASNNLNQVVTGLNELAEKYPAVSDLIKQEIESVGLSFDHVTDTFETAKSAWLKSLDEAQKGVLTNVDKITDAMKKLYKGEAIDSKSAWDILNIDDGKLLSDVRIDANSNYTFDMQQLISLKDKLIEKEIANQEEIINTAKVNKAAAEADIELAKKQLEVKRMELAAAKAPNSMATNVAELDNEVNRLESGVSATQDAIDSYNYAIRNASLYSEELRKKLGDLSNNSEVLQAKIDGLKKSLEQLKEELSALNKEADARLKAQEHVLDGIIDGHKKELKALEKEKEELEKQLEALEKQKSETEEIIDNYKTVADVVTSAIEKEIKSIEDERDSIEEYYDEQINKLKKANDEREDAIEYEQKLANLANAQNNKVRVYDQERGWTYETNKEELKKAQDDLKSFETNQRIKDMEEQKETATQGYDERIKALQDYADQWTEAVNSVTDAENELLAQEILGSDWREKITKQDLITLNKFKTGFTNYNTKLKNLVDTEIASMNKSIEAKDKDVKAKQEQVKAWEEYRTKVEETAQTIKDGLEEYNNYLSDVGVNEKSTNEERQKNLENFATKYKELIDEITKKNSTIEETEKTITGLTEAMNDLNKASSNLTGVNVATNTGSLLGGISGAGVVANIGTIINNILEKLHGLENNLFKSIFHYANGGAADYTGLAWVDGTKTASETVFTAAQSKKLLSYVEALPNLGFKVFNGAGLKNNSTSNTQNVTFNGGITVVANNPEQFNDQMNRYIRTKLTQSKVN